jgi:methylphosphotriester-DNA--protein-cysteine methyltransferase
MDASDVDRRFRKVKGMTLKGYLDQLLKERLIGLLGKRRRYGYEYANALKFPSDRAFYRWVRRAFGMSFSQLQKEHRKAM